MSIIKLLMGGGKKIKSPVFLKEFTKESKKLTDLMDLSKKVNDDDKKEWIGRDIVLLKEGIEGENNVNYEFKNSFLLSLCLHDIRLVYAV